ncbi:methylmalonyl-CoA mutase family protein [Roseibium sp.]|uniref:methylmalonyl-CoA mutase family protein n=1 Tax=Roseibium sp. TaxID=1936156 RepID=UPI003B506BA8
MPLSFTGPENFNATSEQSWWESVDKALKGVPREKLFGATEDGLQIAPIYARRTDSPARDLRASRDSWTITQRIDIPDPAAANTQILEDLAGGADGLDLVFSSAGAPDKAGIAAADLSRLEALLQNVLLDLVSVRLNAGAGTPQAIALLLAHLDSQGSDPAGIDISSGHDPFAWAASRNTAAGVLEATLSQSADLSAMIAGSEASGGTFRTMSADGAVWHNAGATQAQELGLVLASATAQLRVLSGTGLAAESWAECISLTLAAEADQFGTIAKARAIRALWSSVLDGADLPQTSAALHMCSSYRMLTRNDPWVNLLRNTVAAFAAGIGGADSVCVLPHTQAVGLPDAAARRLARNTQAILLEESSLAKVLDPAAGAGAIEDRTERLCEAAWGFFQEIEATGGLAEALDRGLVQTRIAKASAERSKEVARRKRPVTGVSEFPNLAEKPVSVLGIGDAEPHQGDRVDMNALPETGKGRWSGALKEALLEGKSAPGLCGSGPAEAPGLSGGRLSAPYEALRDTAIRFEEMTGKRPSVFLATLGSLAQFSARATWSSNAFAAGGFETVEAGEVSSVDDLVAAYTNSGAKLACLVSSDGVYETMAIEAAGALTKAGVSHLYLAGRPGEREAALKDAGVDSFLFAGGDLLALLGDAHNRLAEAQGLDQTDGEVLS